ncbi:hypothetical protein AB0D49_15490 [Streptomyces sp. NPDC048290]|uniref:hypothetical protein n=1 Tax=Streptomyces sp. NPDC048290 TaxID=3155811 RepID=UPI003422F8E5
MTTTKDTHAGYELTDQALDQMAGGAEQWWEGNTVHIKHDNGVHQAVDYDTGEAWESAGDGQPWESRGNVLTRR